jgi:acyl-CoA thioester hydrolase
MRHHIAKYRIYYEDTDAAGIVYYANYLKFAERARTDWLRERGFNQSDLKENTGIGFVVRHVEADFLAPARLDDMIAVETHLHDLSKVRMKMQQVIRCGKTELVRLMVTLACINRRGKPVRMPPELETLE